MTAWRVLEWSRELGRGAITSPHFPRVDFDASHADVDDFHVGEPVHVELDLSAREPRVKRVWPDLPRFRSRSALPAALALDEAIRIEAESTLNAVQGWLDLEVRLLDDRVRLDLDDANFEYGPSAALDLVEPSYLELPLRISPLYITLAEAAARDYLATRVELTSLDIAVSIIDDEQRFHFVVARQIAAVRFRRE